MKVGRILQSVFVFVVFFINTNIVVNAQEKASICEFSDAYLEWLELSVEKQKETPMPAICKTETETTSYYTLPKLYETQVQADIPTSYDSRNVNGENYVTPVRDQMSTGSCWAFSALSTVESLALKTAGATYNFSPRHLEYSASRYFLNNVLNLEGHNRSAGQGGNGYMASNYFMNGKGPINETSMPFQNNENLISMSEIQGKTRVLDVNGYEIIENSDRSCTSSIKTKIKKHIMEYGAIATNIYMTTSTSYFRAASSALYYNYDGVNAFLSPNHAVTIVGWDDNFSKSLFSSYNQPTSNGAWIAKNSYGTNWSGGKDGYFYISYEDEWVCQNPTGATSIDTTIEDNTYYHDVLGFNAYYGYAQSTAYVANVFSLKSDQELLKEITFNTKSGVNYEVYLNSSDSSLTASKFTKLGSGTTSYDGYHTFKLNNPILLENDNFVIMISYAYSSGTHPVGIQMKAGGLYDIGNTTTGKSYISQSINGPWSDLALDTEYQPVASIKAATDTIDYNFTLGTPTSSPARPYATGNYTITIPFSATYVTPSSTNVVIYNVDNQNVSSNFNITKNTNNIQITNKNNSAIAGDYRVVVSYGSISRNVSFKIYNQYQLLVDGYTTTSTMYDINENTIQIPVLAVGYNNGFELGVQVTDSNSANITDTLTLSNTILNNNATTIQIVIPKDTTPGTYTVTITGSNGNTAKITYTIIDYIVVTSLTVKPLTSQVIVGNTLQYTATITPSNATLKTVTWSSSDTSVATINDLGIIRALKRGTTTITATSNDNPNVKRSVTLTVIQPSIVFSGVTISGNNALDNKALFTGSTGTLTANLITQDITSTLSGSVLDSSGSKVSAFTVSVSKIANNTATVTMTSTGTAAAGKYTLNITGGNATAKYTFTLYEPIYVESVKMSNIRTASNMTINLSPVISPSNAYNKTLSYSVGNTNIAYISNDKLVTKIPGVTTITAKTTDGSNITTKVALTVIDSIFLYTNYTVDGDYILNIPEKTSYTKFINSLNIADGDIIKVYNNDKTKQITSGYIGTGMVLEKKNSLGTFYYLLVVKGDVSGDGVAGSNDALLIRRHVIKLTTLSTLAQKAADVDNDNNVTSADALKIRRYVVKLGIL